MSETFLTICLILAILFLAYLTLPRRKRRTAGELLFEKRLRPVMLAGSDVGWQVSVEETAEAERRAKGE